MKKQEGNVFCNECKWKDDVLGFCICKAPVYEYKKTPFREGVFRIDQGTCFQRNKNNDCELFIPRKWWKR